MEGTGEQMNATTATPPIVISDLDITFESSTGVSTTVIDNVSITCEPGEFVVLIGHSGSGKTTILNAVAGLVNASAGAVKVLGKSPVEARRQIGYMLARDALLPWRTAIRNVEIGLEIGGVPKAERRERARQMLDRVGLSAAADKYPWQLSHGMRQRTAIARTWAVRPELLLMDEPFSALDAQTRETVRSEFLRIWEEDRTSVLFVTHDLTEALLLGDRVVVLGEGKVVREVRVPFDRPRDAIELPRTPEFIALERELRGLL